MYEQDGEAIYLNLWEPLGTLRKALPSTFPLATHQLKSLGTQKALAINTS